MDQNLPIDVTGQESVIAWPGFAGSVTMLDFLKGFFTTLNSEEIHHAKRLLGHCGKREATKRRAWVGVTWIEAKKRRAAGTVAELGPPDGELRPDTVPAAPTPPEAPIVRVPWWKSFPKSNVVALDIEKINLKSENGAAKSKAAKIGVVNINYEPVLDGKVFWEPGSFLDGPKDCEVSGIRRNDLEDGEKLEDIQQKVEKCFEDKLVITVNGQNDFTSMDVFPATTFDLQHFYRRPHPDNEYDTQEMSLRDMYFYHFKEDFQFKKPHSHITDAIATMKVFLEGYIPMKTAQGRVDVQGNSEGFDFSDAERLKRRQKKGELYCKPNNEFRKKCRCVYCVKYYA